MSYHDAVNELVEAENALKMARELCASAGVLREINIAYDKIYLVGDRMFPQLIQEARAKYHDPTM